MSRHELAQLLRDLADGQKVFLLSPRRFGKSSLVSHSARNIGRLLELMAEGKLVSKGASKQLLDTMEMQLVNDRFPRYLRDVRIVHKTGDGQPVIANDAGVLWVNKQPIVLVVFTGHHRGETAALHDTIARVAALVVKYYGGQLTSDFLLEPR